MKEPFPDEAFEDAPKTPAAASGPSQAARSASQPTPRPPAPYKPRAASWRAEAAPMPAWVRSFASTGELPTAAERRDPTPAAVARPAETEASRAQWSRWTDLSRQIARLRSDAAAAIVANPVGSELHSAAVRLSFELAEELDRLRVERDAGRPLVLRTFTPVSGAPRAADAGAPAAPLFDPRAAAAGDSSGDDDILTAMGAN